MRYNQYGGERGKDIGIFRYRDLSSEKTRQIVPKSNEKTIDGELILQYCKGQNAVEKGFRFLEDKITSVAEVYLKKKEERIEVLSMAGQETWILAIP